MVKIAFCDVLPNVCVYSSYCILFGSVSQRLATFITLTITFRCNSEARKRLENVSRLGTMLFVIKQINSFKFSMRTIPIVF